MLRWSIGFLALLMVTVCVFAGTSASDQGIIAKPATGVTNTHGQNRSLDENLFFESWETGDLHGWTSLDLTAQPSRWHLDDYNAFGGSGTSWWMGDSTIGPTGGYDDEWYMVLDSRPITLGAAPFLRFMQRYACEIVAPGDTVDPPYNGWDGMNLRISVNDGPFTVVTGVTPAYTYSSLYSFGLQHNEGPNIPGWAGNVAGVNWHQVTANLSQWANQTVKLRWAFASDPSLSTGNENGLFGWMVDNIRVYSGTDTVYTDDCNSVGLWTTQSMVPAAGNLWHVITMADAPDGTHAVICNDQATGNYRPGMNNALISPYVDFSGVSFGTILLDLYLWGEAICVQTDPNNCDAWHCDVTADSGSTWCAMSNPTCNPDSINYRYIGGDATWSLFSEAFQTSWPNLYPLVPHAVRFRLRFTSTADANVGPGMAFDSISVNFAPGAANDFACTSLQVKYPTNAGRPIKLRGYYSNPGQNVQNGVQAWWQVIGQPRFATLPLITLNPGQSATRDTAVTLASAGTYSFQAYTALGTDGYHANDTSVVAGVAVNPASADLELGYDARVVTLRFSPDSGNGQLVHFTPLFDGVITGAYNLNSIKVQYDQGQDIQNLGPLPIRYKIYRGAANLPGVLIYDNVEIVQEAETGTLNWKTVDVSGDADTRNLTQDFWVWIQDMSPQADGYPQVLGDPARPWSDNHFFTWTGIGSPPAATNFYMIHATISQANAADEPSVELPAVWSLSQNYPNPFNPATEIRYTVPRAERMTLKIYDILGREVATLFDGMATPGIHTAIFDGKQFASGVYVYRLESASFTDSRKMLLLK